MFTKRHFKCLGHNLKETDPIEIEKSEVNKKRIIISYSYECINCETKFACYHLVSGRYSYKAIFPPNELILRAYHEFPSDIDPNLDHLIDDRFYSVYVCKRLRILI